MTTSDEKAYSPHTKAKYNTGFRVIRNTMQRSKFSGTRTIPSNANPHYT